MFWMRKLAPVIAILMLSPVGCGSPGDDTEGTAVGGEIGPDEGLGSAVGLGGAAASRGVDADSDRPITRDDFDRWFDESGSYGSWDADGDGRLASDEFHRSAFSYWDSDGDQRLTETEWRQGTDAWLADSQVGTWDDWDADGDGFVSPTEYNSELDEHNLYDTWDRNLDDTVDPEELRYSMFGVLDRNADDRLDEEEWRAAR